MAQKTKFLTTSRASLGNGWSLRKTTPILGFPYVCPEPVLVKWCILALKVGKRDRFLTRELYSRVLGAVAVATERGVRLLAPELLPRRAACIYIVRKRRVWMSFHGSIEHRSVLPGQAWNKHTQNVNEDTVSAVPKLPSICEG